LTRPHCRRSSQSTGDRRVHLTLAELLIDLVNNSVDAGAGDVGVDWDEREGVLRISVSDNGRGMNEQERLRATDPWGTDGLKHPGRKVGLGLPFMVQTAEETGGSWSVESEPGKGTRVAVELPADHVDLPPPGDLVGSFTVILGATGGGELEIRRGRDGDEYRVSRGELRDAIGEIGSVSGLRMIESYVRSQEEALWHE
jgi:hypothetical protein